MQSVMSLLKSVNATVLTPGAEGTDINLWMRGGVPGASLINKNDKYFYFHHSDGK